MAHKALFDRLNGIGAVVVIDNEDSSITPGSYRYEFIDLPIFICSFDKIKDLEGDEFILKILDEFPNLKKIVVGYDFRFGRDRLYCAEDLEHIFEGKIEIVNEVRFEGISVHSGIIKELIRYGDINKANILLGRAYSICGKTISGQGIGAKRLYATLNLDVKDFLIPLEGVYATKTIVDKNIYNSVSFVGHRVSTDRKFSVETHILEREISFIDERVSVEFYSKIRDNHRYTNLDELKRRIALDITQAKEYFSER